jgi:hypothetical protein
VAEVVAVAVVAEPEAEAEAEAGSWCQQQAQPVPHPPATGARHMPSVTGDGSRARPVVAKTGKTRRAPRWPSGHVAGALASAMGRRSSKTA